MPRARPSIEWPLVVTTLVIVPLAAGCAKKAANSPPPAAPLVVRSDDDAMAGLTENHRHHHYGGLTVLVAMSLETLGVAPERQGGIERLRKDLLAKMEPARAAERDLLLSLADGVASARIDIERVNGVIAQVIAAA